MSNLVSFMSANFVARELAYHMSEGWGQGDVATQKHFRPIATFAERFDVMLGEIKALGFAAIDLWGAHLHYTWATPAHVAIARELLAKHDLRVVSYASWVPGGVEPLRTACRLCRELGIPLIGGFVEAIATNRADAVRVLRDAGVVYGYENHPETSVAEILAKIGGGDEDVVGLAIDTGWLGTGNIEAPVAVRQLAPRMKHLHLKDLRPRRMEKTGYPFIDMGHETCCLGDGVVGVEAIARMLPELGYRGAVAIEHEPEDYDPRADCAASLVRVRAWLGV